LASTNASSRPSDPKWRKNLKQPELERAVKDCDFSYFSDLVQGFVDETNTYANNSIVRK
jgi:hypothetical protein